MRNAGFVTVLLGVVLAAASAGATTIVALQPASGVGAAPQITLYEDAVGFSLELESSARRASEPNGLVARAHATEPGTLVLLGTGLLGVATILRRRSSSS